MVSKGELALLGNAQEERVKKDTGLNPRSSNSQRGMCPSSWKLLSKEKPGRNRVQKRSGLIPILPLTSPSIDVSDHHGKPQFSSPENGTIGNK